MQISQLSPNSVSPDLGRVNQGAKVARTDDVNSINLEVRKNVQDARTDTVTLSPEALKKAETEKDQNIGIRPQDKAKPGDEHLFPSFLQPIKRDTVTISDEAAQKAAKENNTGEISSEDKTTKEINTGEVTYTDQVSKKRNTGEVSEEDKENKTKNTGAVPLADQVAKENNTGGISIADETAKAMNTGEFIAK